LLKGLVLIFQEHEHASLEPIRIKYILKFTKDSIKINFTEIVAPKPIVSGYYA